MRSLRDRFPLTPEQTAETMIEGLISFYAKQDKYESQQHDSDGERADAHGSVDDGEQ